MLIAITSTGKTLQDQLDPRFGRTKYFILYEIDTKFFKVIDNTTALNAPQGAGIQAAQNLSQQNVSVLLTGHCGPNAYKTLQAANIDIYTGVTGTIQDVIDSYKNGKLTKIERPDVEGHWKW